MQIVQIVPLRRLPLDTDIFEYLAPDDVPVRPGSVVRIPFQRQTLRGVVWGTGPLEPSRFARKPILGVVAPQPVLSGWQLAMIDQFCATYRYSRASFLSTHLPAWAPGTTLPTAGTPSPAQPALAPEVWWYTQRQDIQRRMVDWLNRPGEALIVTPTVEDIETLAALAPTATVFHSKITPKRFRDIYEGVLTGRITQVIGSPKAIFLPWPNQPAILLDQEEHRQYKQSAQDPYYDCGRWLDRAAVPCIRTTPAPKVRTFSRVGLHLVVPPITGTRHLGTLGVSGQTPWISPELELHFLEHPPRSVVWLLPRKGFSSALICQACGTAVACEHCHRTIRILRHDARHARCGACQHLQSLPVTCPTCGATHWKFVGLGAERWLSMAAALPGAQSPTLAQRVGTYRDLRLIPSMPKPCQVVIVSGDALLAVPDFAIEEQAWQFLHRAGSLLGPTDSLFVQTFQPKNAFWQQWLNGETTAWYRHTLDERKKYNLPPWRDQWQLFCLAPDSAPAIASLRRQLAPLAEKIQFGLDVQLIQRKTLAVVRLTSRTGQLLSELIPPSAVGAEWRVDIDVDSWLP